jgi:ribosomal-protein-alanine N-acetyltransferase
VAVRYLAINGVWEDHIRYALTAEEWAERGKELLAEWVEPR